MEPNRERIILAREDRTVLAKPYLGGRWCRRSKWLSPVITFRVTPRSAKPIDGLQDSRFGGILEDQESQ